jgi:hypothetical protein
MEWRPEVESAAAEHKDKENQEQNEAHVGHPFDAEAPTVDRRWARGGAEASENT